MSPGTWLRTSLAQISEVFAGSRCLVRALISIHTRAWRTSPEQILCTSVSHLFQSSSLKPVAQRDNWIFSAMRIQLCISNLFCLTHLFSIKTIFIFVTASVKLCIVLFALHVPLALSHTMSRLPHPALSIRGISELWEAGMKPCSYQLPVTTMVQMGICSYSFQESVAGCYSDKQVGLLGKGTKH